ncbi:hypothetical protein Q4F19_07475 [Sphingomonas sp. BIUV-7]|uniref:Uncharacterized protein n=1 Tax=Sphingomonas natans TaxID=3063330 RepID=A0ABT8Y7B9_9SPHN|nr:hypothetical protein [Sphingomonas sp. BIUV-7]MDO6414218.1 hypothetical protein [Sphingomonas sp. BIUV-7]
MPAHAEPELSTNEWTAVAVALKDAHKCGCIAENRVKLGALGKLAIAVFGPRHPLPLADPRLEAIRSFVCASHRRQSPATDLAKPLEDHGFSQAQIDALGLLSR